MLWITVDKSLWTGAAAYLDRLAATPPHRAARRGRLLRYLTSIFIPCQEKNF